MTVSGSMWFGKQPLAIYFLPNKPQLNSDTMRVVDDHGRATVGKIRVELVQ